MSYLLSQQSEVHPDESVSQVDGLTFNDREDNEEDIYGVPFMAPSVDSSSRTNNSKVYPTVTHLARCPPLLAGHFKITPETLDEGKRFLKVHIYYSIQTKYLKAPWQEFIFRFEAKARENKKETSWNMFHETVKRQDGVPYAVCMLCNSAYKHPRCWKSAPTNSLNRHLDDCIQYQRLLKTGVSTSNGILSDYFNTTIKPHIPITKDWIEQQVLKFFISANIPFRQADSEHFQELISKIQVNGNIIRSPSRKVIRARLTREAEAAKANLKAILAQNSSKISLALDMWSTRNKFGFLGIYAIIYKD
jgi:hypothetical protein